jgi:hypothetical protein
MKRAYLFILFVTLSAAAMAQTGITGEDFNLQPVLPSDNPQQQRNKINANFEDLKLKAFRLTGAGKMEGPFDVNGWPVNNAGDVEVDGDLLVRGTVTYLGAVEAVDPVELSGPISSAYPAIFSNTFVILGLTTINNDLYVIGETRSGDLWVTNRSVFGTIKPSPVKGRLHINAVADPEDMVIFTHNTSQSQWQLSQRVGTNYWSFVATTNLNNPNDYTELLRFERIDGQWISSVSGGGGGSGTITTQTVGMFYWPVNTPANTAFAALDSVLGDIVTNVAGPLRSFTTAPSMLVGYVSSNAPDANYGSFRPDGTPFSGIVSTLNFTGYTGVADFNYADRGTLALMTTNNLTYDSFNLASLFNETYREAGQLYPPANGISNRLVITAVGPDNGVSYLQRGAARFSLVGISRVGYNEFRLDHTGMNYPSQTQGIFRVFVDNRSAATNPGINRTDGLYSIGGSEPVVSAGYISGLKYFTSDDSLDISFRASNLFWRTYVNPPVLYSSVLTSKEGADVLSGTGAQAKPVPKATDQFVIVSDDAPITAQNIALTNFTFTLTPRNPFGTYSPFIVPITNILVTTFPFKTDRLSTYHSEYFSDEHFRIPTNTTLTSSLNITGRWDRSAPLVSGNAQLMPVGTNMWLVYPTIDFGGNGWTPVQSIACDYSGFTGPQAYLRAFTTTVSRADINLAFGGIRPEDIDAAGSGELNVELMLPAHSNWMDVGRVYGDGSGCRYGPTYYNETTDVASVRAVLNGYTSQQSSNRVYIRVTLRDPAARLRDMESDWR